jgi:hypothetical protein
MSAPGTRLRALANRFCSRQTMERLIDPVIADQQHEYADAVRGGDAWRARWVRVSGCLAFSKVAVVIIGRALTQDAVTEDRGTIGRTIRIAGVATTLLTALLAAPQLWQQSTQTSSVAAFALLALYLLPQALAIGLPMGLVFGVLCGLRGRTTAPRSWAIMVVLVAASSIAALGLLGWLLPAANQAFRELSYRQILLHRPGADYRQPILLKRGFNELTITGCFQRTSISFTSAWRWRRRH